MRRIFIQTLSMLSILVFTGEIFAASDLFPVYHCLKPNVAFWEKIYTQYGSKQGIIHDSSDLALIYGVIDLVDQKEPNARKVNEARVRDAKRKYESILEKLCQGQAPSSPEEKQVAALLGPTAVSRDFLRAKENLRCQIGQRDRFLEGIVRSGAFLEEIKQILESYGLPADLAYLPHVESSFNYEAYSRFGAAGIWQFTRSTGKRFLEIGYTIDERRDPIRSTHAAAKLLKRNYETLGDWPSAITAYNHGVSGLLRAKQSLGTYEEVFKRYGGPSFKFASRNFYAEFLAARDVAKNYQHYFGELQLHRPAKWREIVLASYLPFNDLARQFGVDAEMIRSLNPALRKPVYKGQKYIPKGYSIRLPIGPGEGRGEITADLPQRIYKPQQKRSRFYTVQQGDTAGHVTRMQGVELSVHPELASAVTDGDAVKAERQIPREGLPLASHDSIKAAELPIVPSAASGDLIVKRVSTRDGKPMGVIRAEPEETIGHYADWLGVSTQAVRKLNGWKSARVMKLHEEVRIPLHRVSKEDFEEKRFEYHKALEEDFFGSYKVENVKIYKIGDGQNIWTLCKEVFEVPFWLVVRYNHDLDFNSLRPSQPLLVPVVEAKG